MGAEGRRPPRDQKQAERATRPRQPAAPTEHRTQAAHHRENNASTQKTAEEDPGQSPHSHRAKAPQVTRATAHWARQLPGHASERKLGKGIWKLKSLMYGLKHLQ